MGAQILAGLAAPAQGPTFRSGAMNHGIIVSFTDVTGGISAVQFQLLGRIAGGAFVPLTFVDLGSGSAGITAIFQAGEITAKAAYRFVKEMPVDDIAAKITVATTTGTYKIDAYYKSEKN